MLENLSTWVQKFAIRSPLIAAPLLALGGVWCIQQAVNTYSFTQLYLLPRNSFKRYITSHKDKGEPWALVTGSSDGIGKGFAEELCSRGVNVVLHGRNEHKLQTVKNDLLKRWPARQIRIIVLDAGADATNKVKLDETSQSLSDINLRILVNNVGGNGSAKPLFAPLVDRSSSDVGQFLDINARFPTEITRVLLPHLIANQPSVVLNLGSVLSDFAAPYMSMYSGTKAYSQAWMRSMRLEMRGENHDIEFLQLQVGMVSSNTTPRPTSFLVPSSRGFAKSSLDAVGCGRDIVYPYWPHHIQMAPMLSLRGWIKDKLLLNVAFDERAKHAEREKAYSSEQ